MTRCIIEGEATLCVSADNTCMRCQQSYLHWRCLQCRQTSETLCVEDNRFTMGGDSATKFSTGLSSNLLIHQIYTVTILCHKERETSCNAMLKICCLTNATSAHYGTHRLNTLPTTLELNEAACCADVHTAVRSCTTTAPNM